YPHLDKGFEGGVNVWFAACMQNMNLLPDRVGCLLNISRLRLKIRIVRVEEHADQSCCWNEIVQEPDPLCLNSRQQKIYPCRVAAWPVEAGDEAELDRVVAGTEDDRNGRGCCFGSERRLRAPCGGDDGDVTVNQIGRERRQSVVLTFRPAILDRHVLTFGEPALPEALMECCQRIGGLASGRRGSQSPASPAAARAPRAAIRLHCCQQVR